MRHYLGMFVAVVLLTVPWFSMMYPDETKVIVSAIFHASDQVASVVLSHSPKSVADIQFKYSASDGGSSDKKVRVLIVPGHEPTYGGAEFGSLKERGLTVALAHDLRQFLESDGHYQVFVTRDEKDWNVTFSSYFDKEWKDIIAWNKASHQEMSHLVSIGNARKSAPTVVHNTAPTNVALRLYGITRWANENDVDIIIHVHFNDYPSHPRGSAGDHSGFAIYVPEKQYYNSTTTKAIADNVFKRLSRYNAISDLPGESSGIVEEPDLIAVGVNNTSDAASMLIEYGYIYESQFVNPDLRDTTLKDMAFQTYLGLQDFFGANHVDSGGVSSGTLVVPHIWDHPIMKGDASSSDIYALQTALIMDGYYPPDSRSLNDCPRTGSLGPCTTTALGAFQKRYGIDGEKGIVGPKTMSMLNDKFGKVPPN